MKYMVKMEIPNEAGNKALEDPKFGDRMQALLKEMKAEAAYFGIVNGQRGGFIIVNIDEPSQMVTLFEPLWFWFKANVEVFPVMLPQDLAKGATAMPGVIQRWGQ
jgi:hypothetical protein